MHRSLVTLLSFALLLLLGACNTMQGMGRDISAAGNWISGAADSGQPQQR